jgi:hypothetical protein
LLAKEYHFAGQTLLTGSDKLCPAVPNVSLVVKLAGTDPPRRILPVALSVHPHRIPTEQQLLETGTVIKMAFWGS